MSGRIKIKPKNKDKKPKIDVFKVIESRFKNMNELRDLIDTDPRKGLVRIRDGAGFREVERGGCLHRNYLNLLEDGSSSWPNSKQDRYPIIMRTCIGSCLISQNLIRHGNGMNIRLMRPLIE